MPGSLLTYLPPDDLHCSPYLPLFSIPTGGGLRGVHRFNVDLVAEERTIE